jgi:hypothetical protein
MDGKGEISLMGSSKISHYTFSTTFNFKRCVEQEMQGSQDRPRCPALNLAFSCGMDTRRADGANRSCSMPGRLWTDGEDDIGEKDGVLTA